MRAGSPSRISHSWRTLSWTETISLLEIGSSDVNPVDINGSLREPAGWRLGSRGKATDYESTNRDSARSGHAAWWKPPESASEDEVWPRNSRRTARN